MKRNNTNPPVEAPVCMATIRAVNNSLVWKIFFNYEQYEIKKALASENFVALEVLWTGTLAIPFGSLPAGGQMRAHFAMFLEFRDGKIVPQRNYDCFEPW
ncbi:MAG: nuclear transport factor 2 family protein [bacterium]